MSRLLLVSNRLPVTVTRKEGKLSVAPSAGGLATGLRRPHEELRGLWFGWPGDCVGSEREDRQAVQRELASLRAVPLFLKSSEIKRYYQGFSNGVLWPLFHYLLGQIPLRSKDWEVYRSVNERFAVLVAEHYQPGDLIWIHDFHLLLLPGMLRSRLPDATIGFFLHIPFPSYEIFRLLPWRDELLRGMLGADLIGFHTPAYLRHFASSVLHILGLEVDVDHLWLEGRQVKLGAFPMGIDAAGFSALARDPEVIRKSEALREDYPGAKIVLGIDRLDYTKGIPRRLLAFERLLEREPSLRGQVRLIQVTVPSRLQVDAYKSFRRRVDGLVGRINGRYGTVDSTPIHYLMQNFSQREIAAMYRAADVMLVTPLRDGMNLVAKEYVACREAEDGVLVLSEFAGAASQLAEALHANVYDIDGLASTLHRALTMPPEEQKDRMRRMRETVAGSDVHRWVSSFLEALEDTMSVRAQTGHRPRLSPPQVIEELLDRVRGAPRLALFLDYDGTLFPFVSKPEWAVPDAELLDLLKRLAARPRTEVHLVTGRDRDQVARWFSALPVYLHAEHGLWSRWEPGGSWTTLKHLDVSWKEKVLPMLRDFARRTLGAEVEEKEASLVWHYRQADPVFGNQQAKELQLHLQEMLSNEPVRVCGGERIVDVRSYEMHKGTVIARYLEKVRDPGLLVAMGDDRTDEDLFAAVPPEGVTIHVGPTPSQAAIRLRDPGVARAFLSELLK